MAEQGLPLDRSGKERDEHLRMVRPTAKLKPQRDMKEVEGSQNHNLGPLTINTQSLESFGLGPNYTEVQPIGFGVHGLVVSALERTKKQRVAAKKIKVESQHSFKYALREVRIMCQMKHENIVRVMDVMLDDGAQHLDGAASANKADTSQGLSQILQMYIVTELLDTNLHVLITQKLLESDHVTLITYQLVRGLHYLRSANVIHRDLKPSNLFINCDSLLLKIGDFGLARIVDPSYSHSGHLTADLGTYWYRAPELMLTPQSYTPAVDMWSAGCIVGEMLLGKPLFTGATDDDQLRHIVDAVELTEQDWSALLHVLPNQMLHQHPLTPPRPLSHRLNDVDPAVIDLLENMLLFNPRGRMTPLEALSHSYLRLYAKPEKEPVASDPFRIEAEVDDISTEHLIRMIQEEQHSRRGKRGIRIPLPSPIDRPKISSATLSLKPTTDTSPKQVPTSPTFDVIMQEQRHNRRNKMSASVDLSFISLPDDVNKPQEQPSTSEQPEKAVYSTKDYPVKQAAPPCPWKWPEIKPKGSQEEHHPSSGAESGDIAGASVQSEEVIFKHVPSLTAKKVPLATDQSSTPPAVSPGKGPNAQTSRQRKNKLQLKAQHMMPTKRGFVNVGGFDDEDYVHLGIPHDADTRRYSADPLNLGKIECYEEKDQARIDKELNRKNRTASMDLSYIRAPHLHFTPSMYKPFTEVSTEYQKTRISKDTPTSSRSDLTPPSLKSPALSSQILSSQAQISPALSSQASSSSSGNTNKVSEAVLHPQPPVTSNIMSSPRLGDGLKKRSSDVGIKIIRSPKPRRRLTSTGIEYTPSPVTSTERPRSSAEIESYSPFLHPERKISITSIESTQVPSRPMSREDSRRSSTTSYISLTPVQPVSNTASHSASISPVQLRTRTNVDKNSDGSPQFGNGRHQRTQSTDMTNVTKWNHNRLSLYEGGNGTSSTSTEDSTRREADYPFEIPERPPSVVSTLSIPPLSPVQDLSYAPTRRISHTTLFLDDVSVNKEISKIDNNTDRCTSTEPPRCSSRLSVDLSFVNKELQKKEEEEKDSVEVSPRKLQEDWEIESQSSQKSEWTLSEILGVPEEEVNRDQQANPPLTDNNGASASLYRSAPDMGTPTDSSSRKVCRTKIDLIPYRVLAPDIAQKPHALTHHEEDLQYRNVPNNDYKSATAKLEDLSLETERKMFTTECFIGGGSESSSRRSLIGKDMLRDQAISVKDHARENLYLDFKNPLPHKMPHVLAEAPSSSALMKFSQYKSEEDLVSPRSHSPRDVVGARAALSRDVPDLPGFKQSIKENLSSLNVSIPKDFPEKRRLIKAHSTESVCSEGESSQKSHETSILERSLEDLIQFSPVGAVVGGAKTETQDWTPYGTYKDDQGSHGSAPECNHCLYQGDCRGPSCGGAAQSEVLPRKDLHLQQPYTPQKVEHYAGAHPPAMAYIPEEEQRLIGRSSLRSSHEELYHAKDLFNERQKLIGGLNGEQEVLPGDSTSQRVRRRVRPKSAKN